MLFGYTPLDFQHFKLVVIESTGLGKDALHIYAGLGLFLLVRLVWRRKGGWVLAWFATLMLACGGEWLDMLAEASNSAIMPDAAHWHDIWNTMFWPTILLLVGRWLQPRSEPLSLQSGDFADKSFEQPPTV